MESASILTSFLFAFAIFSVFRQFRNHYTKYVLFGIDERD